MFVFCIPDVHLTISPLLITCHPENRHDSHRVKQRTKLTHTGGVVDGELGKVCGM